MTAQRALDEEALHLGAPSWRIMVPVAFSVVAIVISAAPMFHKLPMLPQLPLLVVGVWALYQPRLMPAWLALLVGLATDLALAAPFGVHGFGLALTAFALDRLDRRRQSRPFVVDWMLAGGFIAAYLALTAKLAEFQGQTWPLAALFPQFITTWVLFPAVTRASAVAYGHLVNTR